MTKLLTFELEKDMDSLEIHLNKEGLKYFIQILNKLLEQKEPEHEHLMTPAWGGDELTEEKQGTDNELLNHIKIYLRK